MQKTTTNKSAFKNIFRVALPAILITILLHINCSDTPVAGGSEVGNPSTVVGYVYDNKGEPVSNISIYVLPQNYYPIESTTRFNRDIYKTGYKATTDSNGYYIIDSVTYGIYTFSAFSATQIFSIYHNKIEVQGDTTDFGNDTIASLSTIMVYLPKNDSTKNSSFYIAGTEFKQEIDTSGTTYLQVIADSIKLIYYNNNSNSAIFDTTFTMIANDNDTLNLFNTTDSVFQPGKPTGPDTIQIDTLITFSTQISKSKLSKKLEYKFSWGDSISYSNWDQSGIAQYKWPTPGNYNITVIARIIGDTLKTSAHSEVHSITVIDTTKNDTISNPSLSISNGDSTIYTGTINISYFFNISNAIHSSNKTLEYQFCYNFPFDTTNLWISQPSDTHSFSSAKTYQIRARAREIDDTTIISKWTALNTIQILLVHAVTTPTVPTGSQDIFPDSTGAYIGTFSTGSAVCSQKHAVEYKFIWDDTTYSTWSSDTSMQITWNSPGSTEIKVVAKCADTPSILSDTTAALTVTLH